jgi:hypothetical protein
MTPAEAQALLTVAAAFDNRKPDPDAAQAWALQLDGLPFADCRDAVMAHYRTSSDWLMPKDVISAVQRVRDKRIAEAGDLTPPRGLTDDEERAWIGEARRRIADGQTLDDPHGDRKPHPELAAKVASLMPRPEIHPTTDTRAPDGEMEETNR